MDDKIMRNIYDTMLDSGDLDEVMPGATGIWDKDKKKFILIQSELDKSLEMLIDVIADYKVDIDESAQMDDELYW